MAPESTQYGLKNKLVVSGYKELANNHVQISLRHPECNEESNAQTQIFLNLVFLSSKIIRFHYSSKENFDLKLPNQDLEFQNFDLSQKHYSKITETTDHLSIKYPEGEIKVYKNPLQVQIFNKQGELLDSDEPGIGFWSDALKCHSERSAEREVKNPVDQINNSKLCIGSFVNTQDDKHEIRCYKQYSELENPPLIYGLGDKTGVLNRWGRRFRNEPIDALGYDSEFTDPLYKDIPFFISLDRKTKLCHGIFFDNFHKKFFDFGRERKPSPYYYFGAQGGELNYYFIHGASVKEIVSNYLELTGRPPEWPDYTYGYLASGMNYTENVIASEASQSSLDHDVTAKAVPRDDILLKTFKRFKDNGIPATAFHMSSGYIQDKNGQRQQFIWNKEKFPDPKAFVEAARKEGVELCVNLKPVLLTTHPWYKEAAELDLFINKCRHSERSAEREVKNPVDQSKECIGSLANAQDDSLVIDYWGGEGSIMDFRKTQTQKWWKEKIKESFFDNGIFGIWNDNNEYEIFEEHAASGYEHIMSNLMSKLSNEAYKEYKSRHPEEDVVRRRDPDWIATSSTTPRNDVPWILSRSGYAGIQKHAMTWTGDNYSSWKALQYDIPLMSSMSLSGLIHVGDDIGGFWGGKFDENPDPELLLRWIQFGVFTPRFCIHSYKETPTEPDMYKDSHPEFFKIIQEFMKLRTELLPYIKEAAHKASTQGIPIMRPTFYDFPDDEKTYEQNFEYIFGDKYLIAPIFKANEDSKTREIYLPSSDTTWTDYWTGEKYQGGQKIQIRTQFDRIPIFTKN